MSDSTVSGYSYFQEDFIKIVEENVRIQKDLESSLTSTIYEDVSSLQIVDEVNVSNFNEIEIQANLYKNTKVDVDVSEVQRLESVFNIARVPDTGAAMKQSIDNIHSSFINSTTPAFELNDSVFISEINSLDSLAKNQISIFENNNNSLNVKLDSCTSNFNSHVPIFTETDVSTDTHLNSLNSVLSYKINSLVKLDSKFDAKDISYENSILSLTSDMDSTFSLFAHNNNDLQNMIDSSYSIFNDTVVNFNTMNVTLDDKFDSMINSTDFELNELISVNNDTKNLLDSNISEFEKFNISLTSVNSNLNYQIESLQSHFDSEFYILTSYNQENLSTIDENYMTFSTMSYELKSTDNKVQTEVVELLLSANAEIVNFRNFDDSLYSIIDNNYSTFDVMNNSLKSLDNSMVSRMDMKTGLYNIDVDSIFVVNSLQNFRISEITDDVNSINEDITSRVDYEISLKLTESVFSSFTESLLSEDTSVNNALLLQITEIAQNNIDSIQWSLINGKTEQTVYDSQISTYENVNQIVDDHLRVIEEGFKTILITYGIDKPDSTEYDYTAVFQNLNNENLPPIFEVVGKRQISATSWGFDIKLTPYGYNTFLNKMVIVTS